MQEITSFQIISATIVCLIGFAFRLGLAYEQKKKWPKLADIFFLFVFSVGSGFLTMIFVLEVDWTATFKLIPIFFASFLGSVAVPGIGSIKGAFFAEIFKDMLRKLLNNSTKEDHDNEENEQDLG